MSHPASAELPSAESVRRRRAELLFLLTTLVWGSSFPAVKACLEYVSPFLFVGLRFLIATAVLVLYSPRQILRTARPAMGAGLVLGSLVSVGFLLQTVGLSLTTPSRSGFLTALYVILTPLLQLLLGGGKPSRGVLAGSSLSVLGLYFMAIPSGEGAADLLSTLLSGLNRGDLLTLGCSFVFALHIVVTDRVAPRHDARALTFWQLAVAAVVGCVGAPFLEVPRFIPNLAMLAGVAYLAIFASLLAFFIQARYQRDTTPGRVALIYSLESVFAALLSALFLADHMSQFELMGGTLIFCGLLTAERWRDA
jgi:drug/metabolite transporter (DMT)-like permease